MAPDDVLLAIKDEFFIPDSKWDRFVRMVQLSSKCTLHHIRPLRKKLNDSMPTVPTPKDPTQTVTVKFCFDGATVTTGKRIQQEVAAYNLLYPEFTESQVCQFLLYFGKEDRAIFAEEMAETIPIRSSLCCAAT